MVRTHLSPGGRGRPVVGWPDHSPGGGGGRGGGGAGGGPSPPAPRPRPRERPPVDARPLRRLRPRRCSRRRTTMGRRRATASSDAKASGREGEGVQRCGWGARRGRVRVDQTGARTRGDVVGRTLRDLADARGETRGKRRFEVHRKQCTFSLGNIPSLWRIILRRFSHTFLLKLWRRSRGCPHMVSAAARRNAVKAALHPPRAPSFADARRTHERSLSFKPKKTKKKRR